jgi:hypothetical protein
VTRAAVKGSPLGGQQRGESAHLVADENVAACGHRVVGPDLAQAIALLWNRRFDGPRSGRDDNQIGG